MESAIQLHASDNVAVLVRTIPPGGSIAFRGDLYIATRSLGVGHKIAIRRIESGEKIIKYGAPIGSAERVIQPGEHVHVQNMRSDYLPIYLPEEHS